MYVVIFSGMGKVSTESPIIVNSEITYAEKLGFEADNLGIAENGLKSEHPISLKRDISDPLTYTFLISKKLFPTITRFSVYVPIEDRDPVAKDT